MAKDERLDRIAGWVEREDRIFAYQSDARRSTAQELIFHKPEGCADALTNQSQWVIISPPEGGDNRVQD